MLMIAYKKFSAWCMRTRDRVVYDRLKDTWTLANFYSISEFSVTLWKKADMMAISRLMSIIGPQKK